MMTKKEFVKEMENLKTIINDQEKIIDSMYSMGFRPESPILEIVYRYEESLVSNIAKRAGEQLEASWCQWFVFENDFGEKKFESYIKDKKYIIKTIEELYDFIQKYYELKCFKE